MIIAFTLTAWEDYLYGQDIDKKAVERIHVLIRDILRDPRRGIGKPEPLRFQFQACWSRRIDHEHRLVYQIARGTITIIQCRYQYA